ncbi:hypothetical protein A8L34_12030 [Bacillus sp. FJAT-27264]|nr:hypothetical protein A8L34_12030 [Bacillus sp. FJAT-27264]
MKAIGADTPGEIAYGNWITHGAQVDNDTAHACVHAALNRLQTDYIDIYYAHRFDATVSLEETFLAFSDLVRQGKVLYVGISEWTADQIAEGAVLARELKVPLATSQPQYSMLWRVMETEIVQACEREGIGQVVWSPLAQGILSGKYMPGQPLPEGSRASTVAGSSFMNRLPSQWMRTEVLAAISLNVILKKRAEYYIIQD